jgi:hypothetical protein
MLSDAVDRVCCGPICIRDGWSYLRSAQLRALLPSHQIHAAYFSLNRTVDEVEVSFEEINHVFSDKCLVFMRARIDPAVSLDTQLHRMMKLSNLVGSSRTYFIVDIPHTSNCMGALFAKLLVKKTLRKCGIIELRLFWDVSIHDQSSETDWETAARKWAKRSDDIRIRSVHITSPTADIPNIVHPVFHSMFIPRARRLQLEVQQLSSNGDPLMEQFFLSPCEAFHGTMMHCIFRTQRKPTPQQEHCVRTVVRKIIDRSLHVPSLRVHVPISVFHPSEDSTMLYEGDSSGRRHLRVLDLDVTPYSEDDVRSATIDALCRMEDVLFTIVCAEQMGKDAARLLHKLLHRISSLGPNIGRFFLAHIDFSYSDQLPEEVFYMFILNTLMTPFICSDLILAFPSVTIDIVEQALSSLRRGNLHLLENMDAPSPSKQQCLVDDMMDAYCLQRGTLRDANTTSRHWSAFDVQDAPFCAVAEEDIPELIITMDADWTYGRIVVIECSTVFRVCFSGFRPLTDSYVCECRMLIERDTGVKLSQSRSRFRYTIRPFALEDVDVLLVDPDGHGVRVPHLVDMDTDISIEDEYRYG